MITKKIFSQIESAENFCSRGDYRRAISILNDVASKARNTDLDVSGDIKRIYSTVIDQVGSQVNGSNYNWSIEIADDVKGIAEEFEISREKLDSIYRSSLPYLIEESESFFRKERLFEAESVAKKCKEIANEIGEDIDDNVMHIISNSPKIESREPSDKHFFMINVGEEDGYCLASKLIISKPEDQKYPK